MFRFLMLASLLFVSFGSVWGGDIESSKRKQLDLEAFDRMKRPRGEVNSADNDSGRKTEFKVLDLVGATDSDSSFVDGSDGNLTPERLLKSGVDIDSPSSEKNEYASSIEEITLKDGIKFCISKKFYDFVKDKMDSSKDKLGSYCMLSSLYSSDKKVFSEVFRDVFSCCKENKKDVAALKKKNRNIEFILHFCEIDGEDAVEELRENLERIAVCW